jgi:hypothetical protein
VLQVDHCRLGAGFAHIIGVIGIADQGNDLVAML